MSKNKSGLKSKIFRKMHYFFDNNLKSRTSPWINNILYPAYRHRNVKPVSDDLSSLYITQIPNDGAGIGHQMSNILGGVHIARTLGINYAYPGLKGKDEWEKFLGVSDSSKSLVELKRQGYKIKMLPCFSTDDLSDERSSKNTDNLSVKSCGLATIKKIIQSYAGEKIIFSVYLDQSYKNQYEEADYIKTRFEASESRKNDKLLYDKDNINIAIHIRRGDIVVGQKTGEETLTKRWLDIEYYEDIIHKLFDYLRENNPKKKPVIYNFSEGNTEAYQIFKKYGEVVYCFDMSAIDSFLHMVRADYLILSKSSFSYIPALLSDGIRICPPGFWHGYPEDKKWIIANNEKILFI